jgi:hypothetical protein
MLTNALKPLLTLLLTLGLLLILLSLTACGERVGLGIEAACDTFDYVTISQFDTMETVKQVFVHNSKLEAFCDGV